MARLRPGAVIDCPEHRALVWLGHLICAPEDGGCGATYRNSLTAPLICEECLHRLLPNTRSPADTGNRQFSGRAMCAHCYHRERAGGVVVAVDVTDDPCA